MMRRSQSRSTVVEAGLSVVMLTCLAGCQESGDRGASSSPGPARQPVDERGAKRAAVDGAGAATIAAVVVGVADLDAALELWRDTFGLEVVAERNGPDAALAALWGLEAERIVRQALVSTAAVSDGRLHLVEFAEPGPEVRAGAAPTALCPKNLDLYTDDLPARVEELAAAGHRFRSEVAEYEVDDLTVREVQMGGHDATNIVFLELLGRRFPMSAAGYSALAAFITVVPGPDAETAFYTDVVGLDLLASHLLTGEKIETMVGLPAGAGLDVRLLGTEGRPFGRLEIVHYQGVEGENLFPRARPPARGSLHPVFEVPSFDAAWQRAAAAGYSPTDLGEVDLLGGARHVLELRSPAGMRVELHAPVSVAEISAARRDG